MHLDFLESNHIRMRRIGAYSQLFRNSISKGTWKKYGFDEGYEQDNMIFSILQYIMEQSLKEEICTLDSIATFIDEINSLYFKKPIGYDDCKELGDFIVNVILCDEGRAMYYQAFNYNESKYESINISFVKNEMKYIEDIRRVSYSLTNEGYTLLLSTLEIEENLKFTINEIIFMEHLKKADYSRAVDDIKKIFDDFRIRVQKIQSDIIKIRENPLSYSIEEYKKTTEGNLDLLDSSKQKYIAHRNDVDKKIKEFIDKDINVEELNEEEEKNLKNLKTIYDYLSKTIDEDQKILKMHFDLKEVYAKELDNISKMSLIERFNLKKDLYEKVLNNLSAIENIDIFLRPLYIKEPDKIYNINKSLIYDMARKKSDEEMDEFITFDEAAFEAEELSRKVEKLAKYKGVIELILNLSREREEVSLKDIKLLIEESPLLMEKLVPNVYIFREVIIEMLKNRNIFIDEIRSERENAIENDEIDFQLNKCILEVIDDSISLKKVKEIIIEKLDDEDIKLVGLKGEDGENRNFICSNILFRVIS